MNHSEYFNKKSLIVLALLTIFLTASFNIPAIHAATITREINPVGDIEKLAAKEHLIGTWETRQYEVGESMESKLSSPLIPRPNKATKIIEDTPEKTVYEAPFIIPDYGLQVEYKKPPTKVYYKLVITKKKNQTEYPLEYILEPWEYRDKWILGKVTRGVIAAAGARGNDKVFDLKTTELGSAVTDMIVILERGCMEATIVDNALGKHSNHVVFYQDRSSETTTGTIISIAILVCIGLGYFLRKKVGKS